MTGGDVMLTRIVVATLISWPQSLMAQAPATLTVTNARAVKATSIEVISGSQVVARHPRPLAPGAKARIRLPKLKDCLVAITASFEDGAEISADGQDACTDKSVRASASGRSARNCRRF